MPPETLFSRLADSLANDWRVKARPEQRTPPGDWGVWLYLAGRGTGKTRTGAEWTHERVRAGAKRLALVAATAADARDVMVEGESGILATAPRSARPDYEPSKRRLTWANGAIATVFSADEPERLRGPEHGFAWCDELAAWNYQEMAWQNLMLGLRLGRNPQVFVSTTPRPTKLIKDLLAREGADVVVTRGKTFDNAANLAPAFLSTITRQYQGTRIGRQELDGELLEDTPGALWQRDAIERDKVSVAPELRRIVVAIDPATTSGEAADETGIIVAGVDANKHGYVLDDLSGRYAPSEWAAVAIKAYRRWKADRIVGETNNGGEMIENTLRMVDPNVSFKAVHASRGKVTRAEPISALYEQKRISHVGSLPVLEDQMCEFTTDFDRSKAGYSPDRVDALCWALTELIVDGRKVMVISDEALAMSRAPAPPWRSTGRLRPMSTFVGSASDVFGRN